MVGVCNGFTRRAESWRGCGLGAAYEANVPAVEQRDKIEMYYTIGLCFISPSTADRDVCTSSTWEQPHKCSWVFLLGLALGTIQLFKHPFFKYGKMCISVHPLHTPLHVHRALWLCIPSIPPSRSSPFAGAHFPVGAEPGSVRPSLHAPGTNSVFPKFLLG